MTLPKYALFVFVPLFAGMTAGLLVCKSGGLIIPYLHQTWGTLIIAAPLLSTCTFTTFGAVHIGTWRLMAWYSRLPPPPTSGLLWPFVIAGAGMGVLIILCALVGVKL